MRRRAQPEGIVRLWTVQATRRAQAARAWAVLRSQKCVGLERGQDNPFCLLSGPDSGTVSRQNGWGVQRLRRTPRRACDLAVAEPSSPRAPSIVRAGCRRIAWSRIPGSCTHGPPGISATHAEAPPAADLGWQTY